MRLLLLERPPVAAASILLLLLLFPVGTHAEVRVLATVTRISDGDTVTVKNAGGSAGVFKVRIYGIDCPEIEQPQGIDAKELVASLLPLGGQVELSTIEHDRYGRSVAIVHLPDGSTLEQRLLEQGLAWVYDRYCLRPECEAWRLNEAEARRMGAGLWQNPAAVAPWDWRKGAR